jgi:hypothetical protein
MNADVDSSGRIYNAGTTSDPVHGKTRVVLTSAPVKPIGTGGWTFTQTGTDANGYPEGIAVAEPVSLAEWKKQRVVELTRDKQALVAAAAARPDLDYTAEIAAIDAEVAGV